MAIRMRNQDINSDFVKQRNNVDIGVIAAGVTTKNVFVAPYACVIEAIDVYSVNGFSANTSDSIGIRAYVAAASGSTDKTLQVIAISASNASNAYSPTARIRLTPSANNSLTQGSLIQIQISAVCQGAPSQTLVSVFYKPLLHRESR